MANKYRRKTQEEVNEIRKLYLEGNSCKEITDLVGCTCNTIANLVSDIKRTHTEAMALCKSKGRWQLTDVGRQVLSDKAKKQCIENKKYWTVPERKFKDILNEIGIGVRFPNCIKEILNIEDDANPEIYFQYPLQRYVCDFVDETRKVVYAVNGDFWHANPYLYDETKLTAIQINNCRQDKNRACFLSKRGYTLCVVWESEIYWNVDLVKQKILATRGLDCSSNLVPTNSDWSESVKKLWFKPEKKTRYKPKLKKIEFVKTCKHCQKIFSSLNAKRNFCSSECSKLFSRKVIRPSSEDLNKLLWEKSTICIAKEFGVSDKAVEKWAKLYGLDKPPRGYWSKIKNLVTSV